MRFLQQLLTFLLISTTPILIAGVQLHSSTSTSTSQSQSQSTSSTSTSDFDVSPYHSSSQLIRNILSLRSTCSYLHLQYERVSDSLTSQFSVKIDWNENEIKQQQHKNTTKHRVLLYFGEHAREIISPETAFQMIQYLCITPETPQQIRPAIKRLLQSNTIVIYPNINRSIREAHIEQRGLFCARTNPNGVDLNRNWDDHWTADYDMSDANPGGAAFSEEETRILRDAAVVFQPEMFISVHSGTLGMYSPFAYSRDLPPPINPAAETRPLYTSLLESHASRTRAASRAHSDMDIDVDAGEFVHRTQITSGKTHTSVAGSADTHTDSSASSFSSSSSSSSSSSTNLVSLTATQPIVAMLEALNPTYCACSVGAAGATVGYLCPGTSLDWMYDKLDARFSFAVEIYDGQQGYKTGSLEQQRQTQTSFLETQTSDKTRIRHHNRQQKRAAHQHEHTHGHAHGHGHGHGHAHGDDSTHSCFFQDTPPVRSSDPMLLEKTSTLSRSAAASRLQITPIIDITSLEERDRVSSRPLAIPVEDRARHCASMFNPSDAEQYRATVDNWSRLFIDLINVVHEYKVALSKTNNSNNQ